MYIFVRITAVIFIILGILLLLAGIGLGLYGATQFLTSPAPANDVPNLLLPSWISAMGNFVGAAVLFLQGLVMAALGQLMLVFLDIAQNTRETSAILHRMRSGRGE